MKKSTMILLWLVVVVLTTTISMSKTVFASDNLTEELQTNISAKGTFILQAMTTEKSNNSYSGLYNTYTTNLEISKELKDNAKITVNLKGGMSNYTIDRNDLAYTAINKNANSKDLYIEVIYHHESFFCNRLNIDLGKFGISKHFDKNSYADDTSTQFLTGSFVSNGTIESLGDRLGLRANYALDRFDIDYGYFSSINNTFDNNGFNILQINYKPSKKENYRIYGWMDNRKKDFILKENKPKQKSKTFGMGVSLDREINKQIAIFARFGYKNPYIQTKSPSLLWSGGTQIKGSLLSRTNDTIGLAIGQIYASNFTKKYSNKHPETQIELYYKLVISDNLAISPVLQCAVHPKGKTRENLFIYGIRTHFKF
ncbi:MAG: carbohydrate porin [Endomicrobium sp.]|nr:carbohydrate porin [Endomicrobium sp.]